MKEYLGIETCKITNITTVNSLLNAYPACREIKFICRALSYSTTRGNELENDDGEALFGSYNINITFEAVPFLYWDNFEVDADLAFEITAQWQLVKKQLDQFIDSKTLLLVSSSAFNFYDSQVTLHGASIIKLDAKYEDLLSESLLPIDMTEAERAATIELSIVKRTQDEQV